VIPLFTAKHVEAAVSPARAVEAVREAFLAYARGEWTMPPKVYVPAYPAGDFRAMPALGGGHASLKWVTSFPGNPARGLPTVIGANDVTNPDARSNRASPIYGMPILAVDKAQNVVVLKRSMRPGFAGVDNPLYTEPNTQMLFGDARESVVKLVQAVKSL
jgi:hypothetical protein